MNKTLHRFRYGYTQKERRELDRRLLTSPIKIFMIDKEKKGLFHGEINHCIAKSMRKKVWLFNE